MRAPKNGKLLFAPEYSVAEHMKTMANKMNNEEKKHK